jgi:hypothetical protein
MDDLADKDVYGLVHETLEYGFVIPSRHAKEQMEARHYSMADVRNILKRGSISKREVDDDRRCYSFQGNDLEGHPGEIVIELNAGARKMVIVTVKGGVR